LLHGFPASSHQYRNLISALADNFHVVAPDYPGFGNSDLPSPTEFNYTFDRLSEIVEDFLKAIGFTRFGLYMQDYGGPVGFRIISRHPDWLDWLIIQNTNAYEVGFTQAWDGFRNALWKNRTPETEAPLAAFLQLDAIKQVYLYGHKNPELISPDNWNMDFRFMERPNARQVQMDLFYDYRTNVALYPKWQEFLHEHQPKTLIFWGQDDIFFTPEGGESYLKDLPNAEMHRLDTGHFAVEDCLDEIASNIRRFYLERVAKMPA
jgi:pimeloyl-ACP methyl ester carboxylesterase